MQLKASTALTEYLDFSVPTEARPARHMYQGVKPVTDKNIGKSYNKRGRKTYTGIGAKEAARAARRVEHAQA